MAAESGLPFKHRHNVDIFVTNDWISACGGGYQTAGKRNETKRNEFTLSRAVLYNMPGTRSS